MSKMYKIIYCLLAFCLLTSCEQDNTVPFLNIPDANAQIIEMEVEVGLSQSSVFSPLVYASQMIINWGDGSRILEYVHPDSTTIATSTLKPIKYTYASAGNYSVNIRTTKVTRLDVSLDSARQYIHKLQLTNCCHLKAMVCDNQPLKSVTINKAGLKNLNLGTLEALEDVSVSACDSLSAIVLSTNPLLNRITLSDNKLMSAQSLNTLFGQLPQATSDKPTITLKNNAGDATCDRSIATRKGWTVTIE